jgi:hypothetical protein
MNDTEWGKKRFQITASNVKDCLEHLGLVANEEEMQARKIFIKLCHQVVKATETAPRPPDLTKIRENGL